MSQAPRSGNPHPNQIGQPDGEGGDRKRQRRNAIYPNSEAAAVIVEARTSFFMNSIHAGVGGIGLRSGNGNGAALEGPDHAEAVEQGSEGDSAAPQEEESNREEEEDEDDNEQVIVSSNAETETASPQAGGADEQTEATPRAGAGAGEMLVSAQLLGWGSEEEMAGIQGDI